ncbi:SDR family oxidoreductase [Blastococcus sp. MG754426]|nr:SDR family oxidoreductase [Blastococcus sp. MG754426]MCF6511560.1 SDR family oxidoreductase [Blastococcus sp. MG754427]
MLDLTGRTVLVTGASRGIGQVTAARLGELGAHVVAHYGSSRDGAERATEAIPAERRLLVGADLRQPGSAAGLWAEALAWRGAVDVVVCNAAVMPESPIDGPDADWDAAWQLALQVNLVEPAALLRAAVRHFVPRGGGSLVVLSSWAAQRGSGVPALGAYAASKAGLAALTKTIARAHAKDGVLAHLVAPGVVATDMSVRAAAEQGGVAAVTAGLAMDEWVPPAEVAEVVAFLATGRCRHLTGATLDVNGASYVR